MIARPTYEYECQSGHWSGSYRENLTSCPVGRCTSAVRRLSARETHVRYPSPRS